MHENLQVTPTLKFFTSRQYMKETQYQTGELKIFADDSLLCIILRNILCIWWVK